jgi:hypothetical protein
VRVKLIRFSQHVRQIKQRAAWHMFMSPERFGTVCARISRSVAGHPAPHTLIDGEQEIAQIFRSHGPRQLLAARRNRVGSRNQRTYDGTAPPNRTF